LYCRLCLTFTFSGLICRDEAFDSLSLVVVATALNDGWCGQCGLWESGSKVWVESKLLLLWVVNASVLLCQCRVECKSGVLGHVDEWVDYLLLWGADWCGLELNWSRSHWSHGGGWSHWSGDCGLSLLVDVFGLDVDVGFGGDVDVHVGLGGWGKVGVA